MSRTDKVTAGDEAGMTQGQRPGRAGGRTPGRALGRVLGDASSDCRCGQELDMCARAHCPRCGRSISQA